MYESWIENYLKPRYPELVPILKEALDAYENIESNKSINEADLMKIVEVASSHRGPLYESVTTLLGELSTKYAEACEAIDKMFHSSKAQIRFNALLSLNQNTPNDLCLKIISKGLLDKSTKVKIKAADWAERLNLVEVVPFLESALSSESNEKVKCNFDFSLRLLRDGYILRETDENIFTLSVRHENSLGVRRVTKSELDTKGLEALIEEMQDF